MKAWKLLHSLRGVRPLAVISDGIICYSKGSLYKFCFDLQEKIFLCQLPPPRGGRLVNYFRIVDRVLRASPTHAIVFDDSVLIARRSEVWRFDLQTQKLSLDFTIPEGRRSLGFTSITQADGNQEIIFGEYFSNPDRRPVRIWGRSKEAKGWSVRATFEEGEIEHVHAVSCIGGKVYVLTGDFGAAAGVWASDMKFSNLHPLVRGKQEFRAAWMEELSERIYFATDTQLEKNGLYFFDRDISKPSHKPLAALNGSSIYAGRGQGYIFFSTSVECGMPTGSFLKDLIDTKPGPGVLSSKSSLFAFDESGHVSEIYFAEKDFWPFRLGQIGTFMFPSGVMPANRLIAYGVALKSVDDTCLIFGRG